MTHSLPASLWQIVVLLKWALTVSILLFVRNYPGIQIALLFYLSVLVQSYILLYRPFIKQTENYLQLLNEYMVTLYLIACFLVTDYIDETKIKEKAGWAIVGVIFMVALGNFMNIIAHGVISVKEKFKVWRIKV